MFIRTHEVFTPSVASHVNEWTEAGFEPEYARKLVLYQRLAINPKSGEMGPVTEAQRGYQSNLFSSEQALNLCGETDPEQWNKDWNVAKNAIKGLKDTSLVGLIDVADTAIPELKRFEFLKALNTLLCQMGRSDTKLCELGTDLDAWKKDVLGAEMAGVVASATADKQVDLLKKLSELVCTLEKAK
jgi:hypothetical protein